MSYPHGKQTAFSGSTAYAPQCHYCKAYGHMKSHCPNRVHKTFDGRNHQSCHKPQALAHAPPMHTGHSDRYQCNGSQVKQLNIPINSVREGIPRTESETEAIRFAQKKMEKILLEKVHYGS